MTDHDDEGAAAMQAVYGLDAISPHDCSGCRLTTTDADCDLSVRWVLTEDAPEAWGDDAPWYLTPDCGVAAHGDEVSS